MSPYRHALPQLTRPCITDGGLETTLVFLEGMELPCFASFPLLDSAAGTARLRRYFQDYIAIADRHGVGIVLESPTWRANADWGAQLGYDRARLADVNRRSIELMDALRRERAPQDAPVVISGNLGPRGDGYAVARCMSAAQAEDYHGEQIRVLADTAADLISAFTLNYADEAIGIVRAARASGMPVVISFTVETDGRLPDGTSLADAIAATDAATDGYPAYYMINCAHPSHFDTVLPSLGSTAGRLRGVRANASCKSHAELDESTELDIGDPAALGRDLAALRHRHAGFSVLGGCCGTDERHLDAIGAALAG